MSIPPKPIDKKRYSKDATEVSKAPLSGIFETPSGHIVYIGDERGKETIIISHKGGSHVEFTPDGSLRMLIASSLNQYVKGSVAISSDHNIDIKMDGHGTLQVGGGLKIEVTGDAQICVAGGGSINFAESLGIQAKNIYIGATGNMNLNVEGNFETVVKGKSTIVSDGNMLLATGGSMERASSGNMSDKASQIDHNSGGSREASAAIAGVKAGHLQT